MNDIHYTLMLYSLFRLNVHLLFHFPFLSINRSLAFCLANVSAESLLCSLVCWGTWKVWFRKIAINKKQERLLRLRGLPVYFSAPWEPVTSPGGCQCCLTLINHWNINSFGFFILYSAAFCPPERLSWGGFYAALSEKCQQDDDSEHRSKLWEYTGSDLINTIIPSLSLCLSLLTHYTFLKIFDSVYNY